MPRSGTARRAAAWTIFFVLLLAGAAPLSMPEEGKAGASDTRQLTQLGPAMPHQAMRTADGKSRWHVAADPALLLPAVWLIPALTAERRAEARSFVWRTATLATCIHPRAPPLCFDLA